MILHIEGVCHEMLDFCRDNSYEHRQMEIRLNYCFLFNVSEVSNLSRTSACQAGHHRLKWFPCIQRGIFFKQNMFLSNIRRSGKLLPFPCEAISLYTQMFVNESAKCHITCSLWGNSTGDRLFPSQRERYSNMESISRSWHHYMTRHCGWHPSKTMVFATDNMINFAIAYVFMMTS